MRIRLGLGIVYTNDRRREFIIQFYVIFNEGHTRMNDYMLFSFDSIRVLKTLFFGNQMYDEAADKDEARLCVLT